MEINVSMTWQWRIQDFPEVGGANTPGAPIYDFAKFPQKLYEIKRIWIRGGHVSLASPLDPPLIGAFNHNM